MCLTMHHMLVCVAPSSLTQLHPCLPRQILQSKKQGTKVAALAAMFASAWWGATYIPVSFSQVKFQLSRLHIPCHPTALQTGTHCWQSLPN